MNDRQEIAAASTTTSRGLEQDVDASERDYSLAYALLRAFLGVNIAMHGISRILMGVGVFAAGIEKQFATTVLPHFAVAGFASVLPWAEASIGLLILFGAATRYALVVGALLMIVLTFGSNLHQDWQIAGLQLIYAIAYALLIAFQRYNAFSLDQLLSTKKG
jgi:thiosulfate dehydrogenase (quinone) large subunit